MRTVETFLENFKEISMDKPVEVAKLKQLKDQFEKLRHGNIYIDKLLALWERTRLQGYVRIDKWLPLYITYVSHGLVI